MKKAMAGLVMAVLVSGCSSGGGDAQSDKKAARDYVSSVEQNARAAARDTNALVLEVERLGKGTGDIDEVGAQAQALHDHLDDFYQDILTEGDIDNDDQTSFGVALMDLRETASAAVAFSENPSGAKAQKFGSRFGKARAEWNHAVAKLWGAAGRSSAPLIRQFAG